MRKRDVSSVYRMRSTTGLGLPQIRLRGWISPSGGAYAADCWEEIRMKVCGTKKGRCARSEPNEKRDVNSILKTLHLHLVCLMISIAHTFPMPMNTFVRVCSHASVPRSKGSPQPRKETRISSWQSATLSFFVAVSPIQGVPRFDQYSASSTY